MSEGCNCGSRDVFLPPELLTSGSTDSGVELADLHFGRLRCGLRATCTAGQLIQLEHMHHRKSSSGRTQPGSLKREREKKKPRMHNSRILCISSRLITPNLSRV